MFKLVVPCCGIRFLRHSAVRLTSTKKSQCLITDIQITQATNSQFYNNHRNNSSDSRIRNFYEYPDINEQDDDPEVQYSSWEGRESRHAHSIMENKKSYSTTVVRNLTSKKPQISETELDRMLTKNFRLEPIASLVNDFRIISHHAKENHENIYDPKYDNVLKSLACNARIFGDDEICHVLQSLMLWFIECNDRSSTYSSLYTALDAECLSRSSSWPLEKILFVSDHWYRLRLIRSSKFMLRTMTTLGNNAKTLSTPNLVQFMFYTSVFRKSPVNFRNVEANFKSNIKYLNINEIAIIALGFFKSQTMIRDRGLLTMIIQRTINEIESINEISLAAILKIVRYSIHLNDLDYLCKLLEKTVPQIPRLSATCLVHVILAATNRSLFYADLLNAVAERFYIEISKLRVKDIRSLVFALSSFNYVPEKQPDILDRVIKELNKSKRQNEFKRFPECFASCLHHLSILNIHPKNLIAQALDPERIEKAYGSNVNTIRREIFALDLDIEAEIPDYRGPRLDAQTRENVAMRLTESPPWPKAPQLTATNYFMLDVIRACEEYLGSKKMVHVDHILPQYQRPDIIICVDKINSPIPISLTLAQLPFGTVKHPPEMSIDDIRWLVLIIGSNNSYAKNTRRLLGHICAKRRQLEHIGYTPFVIFWQDWKQLKTDADKFKYLQCKVFT